MADVTLMGATYSDVPAVDLPKSGGGTARFYDPTELTYVESVNGMTGTVTLTIPPSMTVLSYGHSTWAEAEAAYLSHSIVYCAASSNSNPATGTQGRMAFLAYVNNAGANPTEFEFQYYRSVATHSASQQGDQVYVYKLHKTNGWSVTTREAYTKMAAGTGLTSTYSSGTLTLKLGAITSDTSVASGDKLLISDASDSSNIKRSGIAFGSSTTTFLRNDGTWQTPSGGGGGSSAWTDVTSEFMAENEELGNFVTAFTNGQLVYVTGLAEQDYIIVPDGYYTNLYAVGTCAETSNAGMGFAMADPMESAYISFYDATGNPISNVYFTIMYPVTVAE